MKTAEHDLQVGCVTWFRCRFPQYLYLLFAVPNGGQRNVAVAGKLKAEGVLAGVADLLLLIPNEEYHGLCVELKAIKGRQTEKQSNWQQEVEKQGYRYVVCRSIEDFIKEIERYLK